VSAPLRVAVVGCGNIAQMMHLPTLAERPDLFSIAALVDTNAEVLALVGARYAVPPAWRFTELAAALKPDVDAVLVVHGGSHKDATVRALEAGKHVFVEKPLGYSAKETADIVAVAAKARGVLMVGYQKRFNPSFRAALDHVRTMDGLRFVDVTVLHPDDADYHSHHAMWPPRPPRPSASDAYRAEDAGIAGAHASLASGPMAALMDEVLGEASGQGSIASGRIELRLAAKILTESLIHDLNLLRAVLGEPERVLSSHVWNRGLAQHALVQFARGVHASLSWIAVPGLKDYDERVKFIAPLSRCEVRFPSPYLRHTPAPLTIERMDGAQLVVEQRVVSHDDSFRLELHHFHECVRTGARPLTDTADAIGDARFIEMLARAYA
jgi:predicted dehydrogenase